MEKIRMKQNDSISFEELFDMFIKVKKAQNLADDSIKYYIRCYISFSKFYDPKNACSDITSLTLIEYINYQKENVDIKDVTINTQLRGIKSILYYGMEQGYLSRFKIQLLKCEKEIKEVYSDEELKRLLKKPSIKKCSFVEYRNWVITNYLLATANRLSTLTSVKVCDIFFENNEIYLRKTKNRRQYIIPLSSKLSSVLREYMHHRGGNDNDYLFCTIYGTKLSNRALQDSIMKYNHQRGVLKTSVHLYRNTFAKHYLLEGGDIIRLKEILGHSSLEMVKVYVDMYSNDLKVNFDRFNPLDNISENRKVMFKKG